MTRWPGTRTWSLLALLVCGLFCSPAGAFGQELVLPGRVLGPAGEPMAGLDVLFHRVTPDGGELLGQSTSGENGGFTLRIREDTSTEGVYFVATRYDGRLYIGPLLKPPFPEASEYVVQVGVPGVGDVESLAAAATPAMSGEMLQGRRAPPGALFGVLLLSAAIAAGAVLSLRGVGPLPSRRAMIRLAELEARHATGQVDAAEYASSRRQLLARITDLRR